MTKYALLYKNENNDLVYVGSFKGKNHYKIKFVMYRYLKTIIGSTSIIFCVHAIRSNKFYAYVGETTKLQTNLIKEIKSINRVYKASDEQYDELLGKLKNKVVPYIKTHSYREEIDNEELSMSESDSEFDSN